MKKNTCVYCKINDVFGNYKYNCKDCLDKNTSLQLKYCTECTCQPWNEFHISPREYGRVKGQCAICTSKLTKEQRQTLLGFLKNSLASSRGTAKEKVKRGIILFQVNHSSLILRNRTNITRRAQSNN